MERIENIVIVGAGIAGLTTALGLHRMGIRSLVLESSNELRVSGFAFTTWTNAWRALDAIGIGDSLRHNHQRLEGLIALSSVSGLPTTEISFNVKGKLGEHEVRCVRRKELLETLAKELPEGTIQYGAKVVAIDDEENHVKLLHLADASTIKTKVLVGCDGVNSVVAKSIGIEKPSSTTRSAIRGCAEFPNGHSFEPKFLQFFGDGFRAGFIPCDHKTMYWFFTYSLQSKDQGATEEMEPSKMKQFVLENLGTVAKEVVEVVEKTSLDCFLSSPLKFRNPLNLLWPGAIYKENVCVTGDALHAMTPDLGQGACAALEDGVVLARCLADVFSTKKKVSGEEEEHTRIRNGLKKFAEERKWRSFRLIATAYFVGEIQQSSGKIINFLRDKILSPYLVAMLLRRADFDCGKLMA
ncbi:hypothetical protein ACHQM5_003964 [Ranunculus cassubicifolius]